MQLTVDLGDRSYPIHIAPGAMSLLGEELRRIGATAALIVTNDTVGPLYLEKTLSNLRRSVPDLKVVTVTLPDGECYKDLVHVQQILDAAGEARLDRKSVMVALGGGVVGDMTGFAAAIWMRGIDFIQIPTTLLSQVDSSVGGKTGVNLPAGKNLVGAFHQPRSVLIDTEVLKTLPAREVSAGIAEVIKYGLLGDADFVTSLESDMLALRALDADVLTRVIAHCCRMKAGIVRADEKEHGERAKLNLGHTFGHAVEKLAGFGTWLHGEAVGAGLVMAAVLSEELGYIGATDVERVRKLVESSGLPVVIEGISASEAMKAMAGDKKAVGGVVRFVVMRALGATSIETVEEAVVRKTMARSGWV